MNQVIRLGIAFLTCVVGYGIIANYGRYFPPDFESDFLQGREEYFWGWYSTAFFAHVLFSPIALLLGLLSFSNRLLHSFPGIHRFAGRVYVYSTLLIVVPSGMVMAVKSFGGWIPMTSFLLLGLLTWWSTLLGLLGAIGRDFRKHKTWMTRSYLLMFSAIVLRINEQLMSAIDPELAYQINSWISWIPAVLFFEVLRDGSFRKDDQRPNKRGTNGVTNGNLPVEA